jgi:rfaE bifunctional protein nucleotidyltransferase chain/domain
MYFSESQAAALAKAHTAGKKIVLVTGVFDILHQLHRLFLEKAKAAGDFLVVGLESDLRVTAMKGKGRPINPELVRQKNVTALNLADIVFILPEQFAGPVDHEALIAAIRPAVLAVSSHTKHLESKSKILQKHGGQVIVVLEHDPSVSTTKLLGG